MILGQLPIHMEENKVGLLSHIIKKIQNIRKTDGLNIKCKQIQIKILKEK